MLRRKTYANTRDKHTVPLDILRAYDRQDLKTRYALTGDSYKQLIHHADFAVPVCSPPAGIPSRGEAGGVVVPTNISVPDARGTSPAPYLTPPATPPRFTYGTIPPAPPAPPRRCSPVPQPHQSTGASSYTPPRLAPHTELERGSPGCVSGLGIHAFRLVKGAAGGVARGIVWFVKQVAELAAKTWGWLRGGDGGVPSVYL